MGDPNRKKKFLTRTVTSIALAAIVIPAYFLWEGMALKIILSFVAIVAVVEYTSFTAHAEQKEREALLRERHAPRTPNFMHSAYEARMEAHIIRKRTVGLASGIFMAILFIGCMSPILIWNYSRKWLGLVVFTSVMTDIGAYLVGVIIGGKLIKWRPSKKWSPNKTCEGFIGGYLIGAGACYVWTTYILKVPLGSWVIWVMPILAILGDLFESGMKRFYGVKDANDYVPDCFKPLEALLGGRNGHGGYLDRLDSLTFNLVLIAILVEQTL